jgi:amino acid adenylation domain-containing protein
MTHSTNRWQPDGEQTFVDIIRRRASEQHADIAYTFLPDGEDREIHLSYGELDRKARAIAANLQKRFQPGGRVLLLFPPGMDYICAFVGCLYAGLIAVPAYPPKRVQARRSYTRLETIIRNAAPAAALSLAAIIEKRPEALLREPLFAGIDWIASDEVDMEGAEEWSSPPLTRETLAFLQYTSGSTGDPKGVMVSHGNLIHNEQLMKSVFAHDDATVIVGWLPLFHDMGLVGTVLHPLYIGVRAILMPPMAFLQRPVRWLKAISRYGATTSGGPNFAFDLCARKVSAEDKAALDLSKWKVAFNGSEAVRAQTLDRFCEAFAECGFSRKAFLPCYGLAESCLMVTGREEREHPAITSFLAEKLEQGEAEAVRDDSANGRSLVGCGHVVGGQLLMIVDPQNRVSCPQGRIGEIWVSGRSVAAGYWGREAESKEVFQAHLPEVPGVHFLRTGDLGFEHGGELYIVSRLKDLLIFRGRNYSPQDIEEVARNSHPALQFGAGAAFSMEVEGEERLVIVQEAERNSETRLEDIVAALREAVTEEFDLSIHDVALIRLHTLPKTSSGKVQRQACKLAYLNCTLSRLQSEAEPQPQSPDNSQPREANASLITSGFISEAHRQMAGELCEMASRILRTGPTQVMPHDPLSRYGLDSLAAAEITHEIGRKYGIEIDIADVLECDHIAGLAAEVKRKMEAAAPVGADRPMAAASSMVYPLAQGQRALLFLQQKDTDSSAYNIARAVKIRGELKVGILEQAFQFLAERHPSLRSTYAFGNDGAVQQIQEANSQPFFHYQRLTDMKEIAERIRKAAHRHFDLENEFPLQIQLFRTDRREYLLLMVIHHIASDFWSLAILWRELWAFYAGVIAGQPTVFDALTSYAEFVRWQKEMVNGPEGERHFQFWRDQLAGELPVLNLPCDHRRPEVQTHAGGTVRVHLDGAAVERLKMICSEQHATLSMGVLAAFQVFLSRYSGQNEFIVGMPVAGRKRSNFFGVAGYFVNSMPLRLKLEGTPVFGDVVAGVRAISIAAFRHNQYPFNVLVDKLAVQRTAERSPVFDVMFVMQQAPPDLEYLGSFAVGDAVEEIRIADLLITPSPLEDDSAQFDLTLMASETRHGMICALQYNTSLFTPATAQRMADHLQRLMASLTEPLAHSVWEAPLLSPAEHTQILSEWNATEVEYGGPFTLQELFELQVKRTPAATAVKFGEASLSYTELNARADALAWRLRKLGAGTDKTIGVCLERSANMVIALLGILKSGAAYLPLDPDYPAERLAFMMKDAAIPVLITGGQARVEVPAPGPVVINLDHEQFHDPISDGPLPQGDPDNIAYVIYTSGSTGLPKGVMVSHRSICNRLLWMQQAYSLTPGDTVLQKTPFSFDVSVWEFFWPLMTGACLVVAPPDAHKDPEKLSELIVDAGVTVIHFVPSMLRAFLSAARVELCSSLRIVICSGEALPPDVEHDFLARSPARLENLYGPTEAAVDVTYWSCTRSDGGASVPIGIPIANTQMYILDDRLNPVPQGVSGELYIAGRNLARGYLNRPELTAERFLPHPFSRSRGERLYRTGDIARYFAGGVIDFLGRADRQVKIRGNRVELGEIEAVLREFPGVQELAVTVREFSTGNLSLIAYFVPKQHVAVTGSELRSFAAERLPAHELPAFFVAMQHLPLTPSGKLDYRSLPAPAAGAAIASDKYVAPVTIEQKILASVWEQVLGAEKVGTNDGFFELGGDSIRCIEVVARARTKGLRFSIQDMFRYQTIGELARHLPPVSLAILPETRREPMAMLQDEDRRRLPSGLEDAYPMSILQQGLFFHNEFGADYEIYVTTVLVRSRFSETLMDEAFRRVVQRHPMLRTSFDVTCYSEPLQLVHQSVRTSVDIRDLRSFPPETQHQQFERWLETEKQNKFDWKKPSLARLTIHLRSQERFHITLSEPFFDGWSAASCLSEVLRTYGALLENPETPPNAPLACSFADFVALEREALHSPECQKFWEDTLRDCTFQRLPALEAEDSGSAPIIGRTQINISGEKAAQLRHLSRTLSVPLKSVMLAAHVKVMSLFSGIDVLTGILANGRPESEDGDKVLGVHLSALPFRASLCGRSWRDLIQHVLEVEREMLPHRRYPIAELQRQRSRQPLFEAVFNFTHFRAYSHVRESSGIEILDGYASEQTYFPLTVHCNIDHATADIRFALDYNSRRFSKAQAQIYAEYHARVLDAMVAEPSADCERYLPLLPSERAQIDGWNATESEYNREQLIHELFELQVARSPLSAAVQDAAKSFSYQELDARANQLAGYLRRLGAGPDVIIGVCLERSVEIAVAFLAVLKAGGACLPIDPAVPESRIRFMLEDTGAPILLTQHQLRPLFTAYSGHVLLLDSDWEEIAKESAAKPACRCDSENLAYVLYTSGSTGIPKGVQVCHKSVVNILIFMKNRPGLGPNDTVLSVTSVSFDMFVADIYLPLIVGAKLVFETREVAKDGYALRKALKESGATLLQGTPATWQLLMTSGTGELGAIKLLSAGDVLTCEVTSELMARGCSVWNLYGTTETAVYSCSYKATAASVHSDSIRRGWVGTGRPVANTQMHIMNSDFELVPAGVPGEMFIGGDGLARGYLNRPEMTAEKFVPDPLSSQPGARLYRTGDQGSWLLTGELDFIGRLDHQVKIRGFRVEPGETEAILNEHPGVHQAAVIARKGGPDDGMMLVAYVVTSLHCTVADLRKYLAVRVPGQQIPSAFVFMDALPLTSSGKIDRRALPAPDDESLAGIEGFVAPRNSTEEKVAAVWQEVLRRKPIGVFDDFFDLGGHSLLATQIVARLRALFQVELPLPALFETPTVAGLSETLRSLGSDGESEGLAGVLEELEQLSEDEVRFRLSLPALSAHAAGVAAIDASMSAKERTGDDHSGQD